MSRSARERVMCGVVVSLGLGLLVGCGGGSTGDGQPSGNPSASGSRPAAGGSSGSGSSLPGLESSTSASQGDDTSPIREPTTPSTGAAGDDSGANANPIDINSQIEIQASLDNMRWDLPCTGAFVVSVCTVTKEVSIEKVLTGDSNRIYNVRLRFRGVVEQKTYEGGTNDGAYFQIGGQPAVDTWNVYQLRISAPPQTYYLNRGLSYQFRIYPIDYEKDVQIAGGATVTMFADTIHLTQITNNDGAGAMNAVPDLEPAYDGQFIQMNVLSITPQ